MGFIKKQAAGFYLTILTAVSAAAGIIAYIINCNTSYFSNMGVNGGFMVCAILAVLLMALLIAGSQNGKTNQFLDILPVASGILLMASLVILISIRVNSIATILSFERNDQTMADLSSAMAGMACCLLAVLLNIAASFFAVVKDEKGKETET